MTTETICDDGLAPVDRVFSNPDLSARIIMHAMPQKTRALAAAHGLLGVLECCWTELPDDGGDLTLAAAAGNHVNVLAWLCARKTLHITDETFDAAIQAGALEAVQWLAAHAQYGLTKHCLANSAALTGTLPVLRFAIHNFGPCTDMGLVCAAERPDSECFYWLVSGKGRVVIDEGESDPIGYYLLSAETIRPDIVFDMASAFPGCVYETHAFLAAGAGWLDVLKAIYAASPDQVTNGEPYFHAAEALHGHVLEWLSNEGIAPPHDLVLEVIDSGDVRAFDLLVEHGLVENARLDEYGARAAAQHKFVLAAKLAQMVSSAALEGWGVQTGDRPTKRLRKK